MLFIVNIDTRGVETVVLQVLVVQTNSYQNDSMSAVPLGSNVNIGSLRHAKNFYNWRQLLFLPHFGTLKYLHSRTANPKQNTLLPKTINTGGSFLKSV